VRILRHCGGVIGQAAYWPWCAGSVHRSCATTAADQVAGSFPPTLSCLIYGFALKPEVHNLKLGWLITRRLRAAGSWCRSTPTALLAFLSRAVAGLASRLERRRLTAAMVITELQQAGWRLAAARCRCSSMGRRQSAGALLNRADPAPLSPGAGGNCGASAPVRPGELFLFNNPGLTAVDFLCGGDRHRAHLDRTTGVETVGWCARRTPATLEQLLNGPKLPWEILDGQDTASGACWLDRAIVLLALLIGGWCSVCDSGNLCCC